MNIGTQINDQPSKHRKSVTTLKFMSFPVHLLQSSRHCEIARHFPPTLWSTPTHVAVTHIMYILMSVHIP